MNRTGVLMLGISLSVLVCVGFREFTGEAPTDYVAPDVDQNVVKKPISDHILSEDNKKIDLPAGDGLAATTTIGSSLLSILNAKQQVIPSQLRSQPTDDIKPEDVPPYLDSSSAPPDFVIVKNFSSYHCQTDFPQGISPVIFDSINMPTLDCLQECSKRKDDCLYAISFLNGTCTLMNNCPVYVSGPVPNTIYGLKEKIVTTEKHRSARGLIEPDLTHLWRLNKTRSNYYFETKPIDLPECVRKLFDEYSRNHPFVDTQIPELGIDHVYMVHYTKLVTRRQVITGLHKLQGITSDWITEFDHQNITSEMRACLHETWEPSSYFNGIKKKRIVPSALTPSFKGGELSVNTKHHFIYYDIVRNKYPFSVIFEDDAKLRTGFREWFSEAVRAVPDNFDIIFFGGCLKLYGWRQKSTATQVSKHVYLKSGSRCAHAYAVTLSGAAKLLNAMPMTEVIDFQINRAILEQNMSVYWIEPWLSVQGPVGEAGQPRATATTGGDGEPYNPSNYGDPKWVATWQQGVPNILPGSNTHLDRTASSITALSHNRRERMNWASLSHEHGRHRTFTGRWKALQSDSVTPEGLAAAGFYYNPSYTCPDRCTCFACGVSLIQWEANDDPLLEHTKHAPTCPFVVKASSVAVTATSLHPQKAASKESKSASSSQQGSLQQQQLSQQLSQSTSEVSTAGVTLRAALFDPIRITNESKNWNCSDIDLS